MAWPSGFASASVCSVSSASGYANHDPRWPMPIPPCKKHIKKTPNLDAGRQRRSLGHRRGALSVPNSTRSSECGSSPTAAACTIATLTISKTSSARLNPSSQPGPLGTMSCADYAQLLKTLCLVMSTKTHETPMAFPRDELQAANSFLFGNAALPYSFAAS